MKLLLLYDDDDDDDDMMAAGSADCSKAHAVPLQTLNSKAPIPYHHGFHSHTAGTLAACCRFCASACQLAY